MTIRYTLLLLFALGLTSPAWSNSMSAHLKWESLETLFQNAIQNGQFEVPQSLQLLSTKRTQNGFELSGAGSIEFDSDAEAPKARLQVDPKKRPKNENQDEFFPPVHISASQSGENSYGVKSVLPIERLDLQLNSLQLTEGSQLCETVKDFIGCHLKDLHISLREPVHFPIDIQIHNGKAILQNTGSIVDLMGKLCIQASNVQLSGIQPFSTEKPKGCKGSLRKDSLWLSEDGHGLIEALVGELMEAKFQAYIEDTLVTQVNPKLKEALAQLESLESLTKLTLETLETTQRGVEMSIQNQGGCPVTVTGPSPAPLDRDFSVTLTEDHFRKSLLDHTRELTGLETLSVTDEFEEASQSRKLEVKVGREELNQALARVKDAIPFPLTLEAPNLESQPQLKDTPSVEILGIDQIFLPEEKNTLMAKDVMAEIAVEDLPKGDQIKIALGLSTRDPNQPQKLQLRVDGALRASTTTGRNEALAQLSRGSRSALGKSKKIQKWVDQKAKEVRSSQKAIEDGKLVLQLDTQKAQMAITNSDERTWTQIPTWFGIPSLIKSAELELPKKLNHQALGGTSSLAIDVNDPAFRKALQPLIDRALSSIPSEVLVAKSGLALSGVSSATKLLASIVEIDTLEFDSQGEMQLTLRFPETPEKLDALTNPLSVQGGDQSNSGILQLDPQSIQIRTENGYLQLGADFKKRQSANQTPE